MEREFGRSFKSLDAIFQMVEEFLAERSTEDSVAYAVDLAVEEIFTNMVKYNDGGHGEILIRLEVTNNQLVITLVDSDVEPFTPDINRETGVDRPLEERRPGGLGIHLVRSVVDKISYEYDNRKMIVTVVKNLG